MRGWRLLREAVVLDEVGVVGFWEIVVVAMCELSCGFGEITWVCGARSMVIIEVGGGKVGAGMG